MGATPLAPGLPPLGLKPKTALKEALPEVAAFRTRLGVGPPPIPVRQTRPDEGLRAGVPPRPRDLIGTPGSRRGLVAGRMTPTEPVEAPPTRLDRPPRPTFVEAVEADDAFRRRIRGPPSSGPDHLRVMEVAGSRPALEGVLYVSVETTRPPWVPSRQEGGQGRRAV